MDILQKLLYGAFGHIIFCGAVTYIYIYIYLFLKTILDSGYLHFTDAVVGLWTMSFHRKIRLFIYMIFSK